MKRYLLGCALLGTVLATTGCPENTRSIEIVLVNASELYQVRTMQITDDETGPVTANLLETPLQPNSSRRIRVPFTEDIEASDAIEFGIGDPDGEGLTVHPVEGIDDGFTAGKLIPIAVTNLGPEYAPLG